jgi:hypothetical protein
MAAGIANAAPTFVAFPRAAMTVPAMTLARQNDDGMDHPRRLGASAAPPVVGKASCRRVLHRLHWRKKLQFFAHNAFAMCLHSAHQQRRRGRPLGQSPHRQDAGYDLV